MTVKEIVEAYLREHGFDGLWCEGAQCACIIGNLIPCEEPCHECEPGYEKSLTEEFEDCKFCIGSLDGQALYIRQISGIVENPDERDRCEVCDAPADKLHMTGDDVWLCPDCAVGLTEAGEARDEEYKADAREDVNEEAGS